MATALSAGPWLDDSEAKEGGGGTSVEAGGGGTVEEAGVGRSGLRLMGRGG